MQVINIIELPYSFGTDPILVVLFLIVFNPLYDLYSRRRGDLSLLLRRLSPSLTSVGGFITLSRSQPLSALYLSLLEVYEE